ncbi:MAG: DnaA N-terminal domain-containing protein, partial [Anaerolineae bacterium]|nr:DnaA N-terminal domain-containing protein [Anaerolineae bacterium]
QKSHDLHKPANRDEVDLHNQSVNPENTDLQTGVKQDKSDLGHYVNQSSVDLHNGKSENTERNVNELESLIQQLKHKKLSKRTHKLAFEPVVRLTEHLLQDNHSTAMFYKVLNALYPERLDLYVASVRIAVHTAEEDPTTNSGAVFVKTLRDFAEVAGVDLGLKRSTAISTSDDSASDSGSLGTQLPMLSAEKLGPPSVDEAIWAETQSVLRRQMTRATYDTVIQGTKLVGREQGVYIISVNSEMAHEWLENRLQDIVRRALSNVVGVPVKIAFRFVGSHL